MNSMCILALGAGLLGAACSADSNAAPDASVLDATPPDAPPAVACTVAPTTISHGAELPAPAITHLVDLAAHPQALCNDGTPASYTLRRGVGAGQHRWVVFLRGGGQCSTAQECAERYASSPGLMSSASVTDGAQNELTGILSASPAINPDFYDANVVEIAYCSSDWHTGDRAGDPSKPITDLARWHFRGRAIVRAVLDELQPAGLADATELLLAGGSAGAAGVTNVADDVRAAIPAAVRMVALTDASFAIDYPAYDPVTQRESTARPTPPSALAAQVTAAWAGRGDATCYATAPVEDHAMCRAQTYLYPRSMVAVPTLIRQSQLDINQMNRLIDANDHSAPADAFRERFATQLRAELATVAQPHAELSPHDDVHTACTSNNLWAKYPIGDTTLRDAVGAWYRAPCTPLRIVDLP